MCLDCSSWNGSCREASSHPLTALEAVALVTPDAMDRRLTLLNPPTGKAAITWVEWLRRRSRRRCAVGTLAQSVYADSAFGVELELPHAGSALENPYVYDSSARELKAMADRGLIEVVKELTQMVGNESLIGQLRFKRLR
jgi:hypothetical protein